MSRPKQGGMTGVRKAVYVSKEVDEFLIANSSGNISGFLDSFIKTHMGETRELKAIEIKQLTKEIIALQAELTKKIATRDLLQSEHNLHKEPEDMRGRARQEVLEYYVATLKNCGYGMSALKGEAYFKSGLTGPGNIHLIKDSGFETAEDALAWCKAQKVRQ